MATFRELVLMKCAGMPLAEMADTLQVTAAYCSFLRTGDRGNPRLSRRIAKRALQVWPELTSAYVRELLADVGEHDSAAADTQERAPVAS